MAQYLYFNKLPIPPLFLKWIRERKSEPTQLQKEVFAALKSLLPADYKVEMEVLVGIWPVDILVTYGAPNKKLSPLKQLLNRLSQNADLKEIRGLAKKITPASITGDEATQLLAKGLIYDEKAHKKDSSPAVSVFSLILELTETHSYLKPISKTQGCALEKLIIDNNAAALGAVISIENPACPSN